jgi:muramoyltetrapeptide carboxypeptidase
MIAVPRPPAVRSGDRVGVAALSGPVDPERLDRGLAALTELGFEPVLADNLGTRAGLFAGSAEERLGAFHRLAERPDVRAIFFARGGSGLLGLLPRIDWALLARHPRAYVGYSDLTPLLLAIPKRLGFATFHGPMVAADLARGLTAEERDSLLSNLAGSGCQPIRGNGLRGARPVVGPLVGGCLSLLTATLGTAWAPDTRRAILFLEDVGEPTYRLDRMLTHLRLSGKLAAIRGLVCGHLAPVDEARSDLPSWTTQLLESLGEFAGPVLTRLPAGHEQPNWTLPLGARVRVDPGAGTLELIR